MPEVKVRAVHYECCTYLTHDRARPAAATMEMVEMVPLRVCWNYEYS